MHRHSDAAIVFDLDNTLVHSSINFPSMRRRVLELINEESLQIPTERGVAQLATAEIIDLALTHGASDVLIARIWAAVTDEETRGMLRASVEDDAAAVLQTLKAAGVTLAVLTNNARAAALAALEQFHILEHLDLVLARDDVPALKPSPAGLLQARASLAQTPRLAMVGDASIDGLAANRAGAPFIAFRPAEAEMDRRGVERWSTVQSLSQIPALVPHLPAARYLGAVFE
ncbi:MAG: HAD family hydrolase [Chloroflexota bacterium]